MVDFSTNVSYIWRLLSENERETLRKCICIEHYKKNRVIYSEGDRPQYLMCLLKGKVKVYKAGVGGRSHIIGVIRPIQYFAYRAYFAGEDYKTDAMAIETSTVCLVPLTVVDEIFKSNFNICQFFIKQLCIDLGISNERTVNLTQKHIRGRLAEALVFLIDNYGLEEDNTLNIYLARGDLANFSNMTASNAIRTLSMFVKEKVIALYGRKIKIFDEVKLRKISLLG